MRTTLLSSVRQHEAPYPPDAGYRKGRVDSVLAYASAADYGAEAFISTSLLDGPKSFVHLLSLSCCEPLAQVAPIYATALEEVAGGAAAHASR